jgi:tetratricopeptide (TPR) repeat protein
MSPSHPDYPLRKADWLTQAYKQSGNEAFLTETRTMLDYIKRYEPYNRQLILAQYHNLKQFGEYNNAIVLLEEGIHKFQWDINFYDAAITEHFLERNRLLESAPKEAILHQNRVMELYNEILRRMELLKTLPPEQLQGRDFSPTPYIRAAVGAIYFDTKDYQAALAILESLKESDISDAYIRLGIRYYVASLSKIGQNDENLRKLLIETDPNERMALDNLSK